MGDQPSVAVVGLGAMGGGIAARLAATGLRPTVWDVDGDARLKAAQTGSLSAESLGDAVGDADVVVAMLPRPSVLVDVVRQGGGLAANMQEGATLVDMATDGPRVIMELQPDLAARGVNLLDVPVGRGADAARLGELILLVGAAGPSDHSMAVDTVLTRLGQQRHYCGGLAAGQAVKVLNNLVSCGSLALLADASRLASALSLDIQLVAEVMTETAADSFQVRNALIRRLGSRDFSGGFALSLAAKDLELAASMAEDHLGFVPGAVEAARSAFRHAEGQGLGHLDHTGLLLDDAADV